MAENYREQILRLQREALESEQAAAHNEAIALESEVTDLWAQAAQADVEGDHDTAIFYSREANQKTVELQSALAKLPQQPQFTPEETRLLSQRQALANDPNYDKAHWLNQSKYGPSYQGGYSQALVAAANTAGVFGYQRGTKEFNDYVAAAVDPVGFTPAADADEILKTINETSKYCDPSRGGKPISAKQFNRHATEFYRRKAAGEYPDKI